MKSLIIHHEIIHSCFEEVISKQPQPRAFHGPSSKSYMFKLLFESYGSPISTVYLCFSYRYQVEIKKFESIHCIWRGREAICFILPT